MAISKNKFKKEVSCKTLSTVYNAARKKNIDLIKLLNGVP